MPWPLKALPFLDMEDAIDSRQEHLDVMCFPVLFPDGKFGQYYRRDLKISAAEYAKLRLLNKDSHFWKKPQYVFYLLWQQELRQLSVGIYNLLKSGKHSRAMMVDRFLSRVNTSNGGRGSQPLDNLHVGEGDKAILVSPQPRIKMHCQRVGYSNSLPPNSLGIWRKWTTCPIIIPLVGCAPKIRSRFRASFPKSYGNPSSKQWKVKCWEVTHYFWKKEYHQASPTSLPHCSLNWRRSGHRGWQEFQSYQADRGTNHVQYTWPENESRALRNGH